MSMPRFERMATSYSPHRSASQSRSHSPSTNTTPNVSVSSARSPFGLAGSLNHASMLGGNSRSGAGSPSHSNRLQKLPTPESLPQTGRARVGAVPSRFSPGGPTNGLPTAPNSAAKTTLPPPSQSPFRTSPSPGVDHVEGSSVNSSALLSRLQAGSLPQRSAFSMAPASSPFGPSIFSTNWKPASVGRERSSTLASIASVGSNRPSSSSLSAVSKDTAGEADVHMRTLDYLGLAETPQPSQAQLATPYMANSEYAKQSSRFRSYSVNNKDKYADDEDDDYGMDGLSIDNQYVAALQKELDATNAAIRNHNLAVQAFANHAAVTRPRARTAGVLETPGGQLMRTYLTGNSSITSPIAPDNRIQEEDDYASMSQGMLGLSLNRSNSGKASYLGVEDQAYEGPSTALWLVGIPTSTTNSTLNEIFKSYGSILTARVLTQKNCGFNFERLESAIAAQANLNGKEIFPGAGPIRVTFTRLPSSGTPGREPSLPSPSPDPFFKTQEPAPKAKPSAAEGASEAMAGRTTPNVSPLRETTSDILGILDRFGATEPDKDQASRDLRAAVEYTAFIEEIPPIREPQQARVHDAPKLRDIRKRIDNQLLSPPEIETVALDMLPEIAGLASDYLGNTVVQKLFEHCSDSIRNAMLAEIAPHMAEIGVHKNGTWAAQKIIDVCKTSHQMASIVEHLRPFTVPLFLDQFGNYVLQGCLKFGAPYNDFIFETMLSRMWDIAQGCFGARAMRACLESHHASKSQQHMLAAAIAVHSVKLATNANGALLLTWFLDTCTFPSRRTVLAPRLVPYLVHLCTHKVAYLTVLKVINQKAELGARDVVLTALFLTPSDRVLEAILADQMCGATFIFKVLTTPFFDENIRARSVEAVKAVLRINAQPNQGYKRLMDEVGLPTRGPTGPSRDASAHGEPSQRPNSSRQADMNGHHVQPAHSGGGGGNKSLFGSPDPGSPYDPGFTAQRGDNADPTVAAAAAAYSPYGQGVLYGGPAGPITPPTVSLPQMQYPNLMNRPGPQVGYAYSPIQASYPPFAAQGPAAEQYRQQMMSGGSLAQPSSAHLSPLPAGGAGGQHPYGPSGFSMPMGGAYGYGGGGLGGMQQHSGYMAPHGKANGGRRDRK